MLRSLVDDEAEHLRLMNLAKESQVDVTTELQAREDQMQRIPRALVGASRIRKVTAYIRSGNQDPFMRGKRGVNWWWELAQEWERAEHRRKKIMDSRDVRPSFAAPMPDGVGGRRTRKQKLHRVIVITFLGMGGCWLAQWIWWAGFVGLMDNL